VPLKLNQFKRGLAGPKTQFGLWLGLANPYTAEICAGAAFDWLLLDAEHAPNDVGTVLVQLQALEAYPSHAIVRIPTANVTLIKQMMDVGAQTLLVPMVEDAGQALMLARGMRYPPEGTRGVGTGLARAARWGGIVEYLAVADGEACLIAQIETLAGVRNVAAIAAVKGVDALFIGPSDLAAALGHRGDAAHAEVQRTIEGLVRTIRAAGKPVGILAADEKLARLYIEWGCAFVAVGVDTVLLRLATRDLARRYAGGPSETKGSMTDGYT
jgi:4-hydroxy-2-oxoheptanedioate aldolase